MRTIRPAFLALWLALPIVGVLALAVDRQLLAHAGSMVRIPIVAYDTRNVFSDNVLQFRFDGAAAPDRSMHEIVVAPDDQEELRRVFQQPGSNVVSVDVRLSGKTVVGLGNVYVGNQPLTDYLKAQRELCRARMGGAC